MPRSKKRELLGDYVLVVRGDKPYIRRYPRDYVEARKGNLNAVHPNKLKTWLQFAEVAKMARGLDYDAAMKLRIKLLSGKKVKQKDKQKKEVPLKDYVGLKIQAVEKGLDPGVVDDLVIPAELRKLKEGLKEIEEGKKVEGWIKLVLAIPD